MCRRYRVSATSSGNVRSTSICTVHTPYSVQCMYAGAGDSVRQTSHYGAVQVWLILAFRSTSPSRHSDFQLQKIGNESLSTAHLVLQLCTTPYSVLHSPCSPTPCSHTLAWDELALAPVSYIRGNACCIWSELHRCLNLGLHRRPCFPAHWRILLPTLQAVGIMLTLAILHACILTREGGPSRLGHTESCSLHATQVFPWLCDHELQCSSAYSVLRM